MNSLEWLETLPRFSKLNYNLYRTWLLLNRFIPEYKHFDVFYITGSKGKGTVAATLAAILRCGGIKTGLVTSPHLIDITERINLDDGDIGNETLVECLEHIRVNLPPLPSQYGTWIHSEILNLCALLYFKERGAKTLVLEAGLGGRLDAGNIFPRPIATCVSTVALEHKEILGNTVEEIALEKAGVIKPKTPLVTAALGSSFDIIFQRAQKFRAQVFAFAKDFAWLDGEMTELVLPGRTLRFKAGFETGASRINKAMAACMASFHPHIDDGAIVEGIMRSYLPGRFEVINDNPVHVLDVAHTPESVENLLLGLRQRFRGVTLAMVAGFLADKPGDVMLNMMIDAADIVYFAPIKDPRGYDPSAIKAQANRASSITEAIRLARTQADVICVTGSFSAVGEARILLSKGS